MRSSMSSLSDQLKDCLRQMSDMKSGCENEVVKPKYTVREYKGVVGVFDDKNILIREIQIAVSTLSSADRQNLLIGIRVNCEEELEHVISSLK